ncbi:Nitroreductase [Ceraceosorus guamensis]|uniref:Nitroreductase n=1 Tax=Ceraceosorus guamensis TaxID=1522189 RepID=A0A316VQ70_9BASI|nr:Nitroreductase [Ceraceosorus guamensis]PWN39736.1 Nitroreductase [Ceraceosorus guamensis]
MPTQEYHSQFYDLSDHSSDHPPADDHAHIPAGPTPTDALLRTRYSCRYFHPSSTHPVSKETLKEIFLSATRAPSGSNFQPWKVHVIGEGQVRSKIAERITGAYRDNEDFSAPYVFYPPNELLSQSAYSDLASRRRQFGATFSGPLGIAREDKEKRRATTERNWNFFDAPIALIITTADISPTGAYLDCGFFVMSLLMAARARGLEACVQEAHATYNTIYSEMLPLKERESVVCGVAMGYADLERVRKLTGKQARQDLEELVSWH